MLIRLVEFYEVCPTYAQIFVKPWASGMANLKGRMGKLN